MIDGDILAFIVSARSEVKIDWGDTGTTRHANLDHAKSEASRWVVELQETLNADSVIVALSDPSRRYFRHDVYPQYKLGRTHGETPLTLFPLKDYFRSVANFHPYERPSLEADDVLGILGTHPKLVAGEKIIVTADKDLRQIPGLHYNPRKPELGIEEVTCDQADYFFYQQALSGDPTDGVPGCPRIGPVKAKKILDGAYTEFNNTWFEVNDPRTLETFVWLATVAAYAAKGKDEAYALSQARCIRILRDTDYDFNTKRPILWTPNS